MLFAVFKKNVSATIEFKKMMIQFCHLSLYLGLKLTSPVVCWMNMDCDLKKFGQLFQLLDATPTKIAKKYLLLAVRLEICLISSSKL